MFADDFSGGTVDPGRWATGYWWDDGQGSTNGGNPEREWYLSGQATVSDGALHLVSERRDVVGLDAANAPRTYHYTSGMVTTEGRFSFTYGRVDVRARIPQGSSLWPGIWLLPADRSWPPEIDAMEALGDDTTAVALTYHRPSGERDQEIVRGTTDYSAGFHTFSVIWALDSITWLIDGVEQYRVTTDVPSSAMYLLLNLAVAGPPTAPASDAIPARASFDIESVEIRPV
jgi:beta-glucanase (GH16 family)